MTAAAEDTRAAPIASDAETLRALQAALSAAGYDAQSIEAAFGIVNGALYPDAAELPFHRRALGEGGPLGTLVTLFQLGVPVDGADAEAALAPVALERLESIGLLVREGGMVRSTVALTPAFGLVLACDWEPERRAPEARDHVLGVSTPSRLLACLGVREPAGSALDVGTGCGLHALLAARDARTVIATDVNPRALALTAFSAALNGLVNVETREGSLLEPVAGMTFDRIVSNPPYVISPDTEYAFRDSGLPGDSFCEALVRQLPKALAEGGVGEVLVSWVHGSDEDWSSPLRRWVGGSGCDALLFHHSSQTPLDYTSGWLRVLGLGADAYDEGLERWLDYHRSLGIEQIAWGAVVLRRRRGATRVCASEASMLEFGAAGHHVLRLLHAQQYLAGLPRHGVGRERLALADDVRLDQTLRFEQGSGLVEHTHLRLDGGLRLRVELDPWSPRMLAEIDAGQLPGDVVSEAVSRVEAGGAGLAEAALAAVLRLVELGFLVPAGSRGA